MTTHDPEARLQALGLELPTLKSPVATYVSFKRDGNIAYLSGQGPANLEGDYRNGKVGGEIDVETAYAHARATGLGLLAAAKAAAGSLAKVEILKVFGMVNAVPEFGDHPKVINGCSDLFVEVLGERGRHARSAVGMGSLPFGMTVELEVIIKIHD